MESYRIELFFIALAAALAPFLAQLPNRFRLPIVAVELLLGIFIGPHILNLVNADGLVGTMGELGLTFLLFMVGLEINFNEIRGKPLALAVGGWFLSLTVAMVFMFIANSLGLIKTPLLAAVALSTTALGVLAPILRDKGILETKFGKLLLSAAAIGELGPLVAISFLIIPEHSPVLHTLFMIIFAGIILLSAYTATQVRSSKIIDLLAQTMQSSGQLPVRICIVLQTLLVVLAAEFGFNVVIGAFAAGMVVSLASTGEGGAMLRQKLDAIGYGFLIPFFFIVAGMKFDLSALWASPLVPVQIICLLVLLILVRGAPVLLYNRVLCANHKLPFALYSATGLPLIVIITELGISSGLMAADKGAVLVCTGMISVFLFPILAENLLPKNNDKL
ncbi:cation:proton antiporter [Methylomonas paludis]|uniref:Cation:proton antiporter n=1 Tax=Methylomonas paludis TaxID=1173101 RepID=A0A975MKU7_9GAMM|nr:cation:proton antiporter [Methylomonas paludis]QWF69763.1 cation:proton antiporter [Methylomonas paludis]